MSYVSLLLFFFFVFFFSHIEKAPHTVYASSNTEGIFVSAPMEEVVGQWCHSTFSKCKMRHQMVAKEHQERVVIATSE